jgi:hypothetical protein
VQGQWRLSVGGLGGQGGEQFGHSEALVSGLHHQLFFPHSTKLRGEACHCSAKTAGSEDLQVEEPVSCWDCSSFDFHTTLASMLGATLIRDEVVQVGEPGQKRLLAATWVMVTVGRRIAPPTAAPERSVPVSGHSAPQCPDVCHAYPAGDSLHTPAFSHRGSVHEALASC